MMNFLTIFVFKKRETFKMEALDSFVVSLSHTVGFPVDQLKYILCLLAAYPAAFIFRKIPRELEILKHLFSIVVSITFCTFCLGKLR